MNHPIANLLNTVEALRALPGSFYCLSVVRLTPYDPADPTTYGNRWESINPLASFQHSYSDLDPTCGCLGWSKLSPEEIIRKLTEEHLWQKATLVFCPDYFASGDYGGSLVELSNLQTFLEEFGKRRGVYELYGGYGSSGLALDVRAVTAEIMHDLAALGNYPLRDEEHLSTLEYDREIEAWHNYIGSDFRRALQKHVADMYVGTPDKLLDSLEECLDCVPDERLCECLYLLADRSNTYWETAHLDRWIDVERCASAVTTDDLTTLFADQPDALQLLPQLPIQGALI